MVLLWAGLAQADPLAYVRASSQLGGDATPDKYHPLNLLDDNPATLWCEGAAGAGEGEEIRFTFKTEQLIDRLVVGPAAGSGRVIESVRVSDGSNSLRVELDAEYADVKLRQPLQGNTITVSIEKVGGPNPDAIVASDVACLADVLLYHKRRPFGGNTPADRLRYDAHRDLILGRWAGAPLGAPEAHLTFALDGTWEWTFEPLLGGKRERVAGEYRFRGDRLLMRRGGAGRWADMRFSRRPINIDPMQPGAPLGDYVVIEINGALGEGLAGEYNDARF